MCTDVQVAQGRHVEHVKPAHFVAGGAGVVVQNVVVNQHVVRSAVGVVEVAVSFDVVSLSAVCDVDELEAIIATHPEEVGPNVSYQAGHIIVATVENTVAFGEGDQPPVGGDVVAQNAKPLGADVGDVAHDLNHGVAGLGALTPIVVVLEIGFGDEANARGGATVDVVAVHADTVGRPVGHAVVHVLAIIDVHCCKVVLAHADVGAGVEASTASA